MTQTSMDLGLTDFMPVDNEDSDTQCTPKWIADMLPVVDLDPCSNSRSHIRARQSVALPNDGLAVPWQKIARSVWCNPPYSDPLPWARAGADAYLDSFVEQMWLVKLDPTTRWWSLLAPHAIILLCRDRVAFEKDGAARNGSNMCTAFLWLRCHRSKPSVFGDFAHKLQSGGHVWLIDGGA